MSSKADGLARRIYEEVTGLSWDETVKSMPAQPKSLGELVTRRRASRYGFAKDNDDA